MTSSAVDLSVPATEPHPLERLEAEIVSLASQLTAASARLIALIGEFDAAEGWREWGMKSTAHWLSWQCGIGLNAAREQVRVARSLRRLPGIAGAFAAGRLSYSKVRELTRFAAPDTEAELVDLAESATAAQVTKLRTAAGRARRARDVRRQRGGEFLRLRYDDDGSLVVTARIAPDRAAVFRQGLDVLAGRVPPLGSEGIGPEPDPRDVKDRRVERSEVDALVAMAEAALDVTAVTSPAAADRVQLMLHTTTDELARADDADDDGPGAELAGAAGRSARVHPSTARRLSCDCPVSTVVDDADGSPLHLGRKTRRINGRLRRAVHVRDRGRCRAPGCTAPASQIHHIRHWANGGSTCLANLISLCDSHHWLVHEGGWTIMTRRPGRWTLLGPDGQLVEPEPPLTMADQPLPHDDTIAADAVTGHWNGDRLDLTAIPDRLLLGDGDATKDGPAEHLRADGDVAESGPAEQSSRRSETLGPGFQFSQETIANWLAANEDMRRRAMNGPVFYLDDD